MREDDGLGPAPDTTWVCLYCGHPLAPAAQCPMPRCVEARAAARRRMGLEPPRPRGDHRREG
jgi:hypothetical protein